MVNSMLYAVAGVAVVATIVGFVFLGGCAKQKDAANQVPPAAHKVVIDSKATDGSDIPPNVAQALQAVAEVKAKALKDASVKVRRAYGYKGPTVIQPIESAKRIAVDVEFSGYTDRFKIWDLDIVDGETNKNFGSDPDVAFLDANGKFLSFEGDGIDFTKPIRLLLVYAVPNSTKSIKLSYWGQELTATSAALDADGMQLPSRK